MDERLKRIESKIDKLDDRLDSLDKTSVKQEQNLAEHMRRTELAEANIDSIRDELKPVQRHVAMLEGILKFIGLVGTLVAIAAGVVKVISFLLH